MSEFPYWDDDPLASCFLCRRQDCLSVQCCQQWDRVRGNSHRRCGGHAVDENSSTPDAQRLPRRFWILAKFLSVSCILREFAWFCAILIVVLRISVTAVPSSYLSNVFSLRCNHNLISLFCQWQKGSKVQNANALQPLLLNNPFLPRWILFDWWMEIMKPFSLELCILMGDVLGVRHEGFSHQLYLMGLICQD